LQTSGFSAHFICKYKIVGIYPTPDKPLSCFVELGVSPSLTARHKGWADVSFSFKPFDCCRWITDGMCCFVRAFLLTISTRKQWIILPFAVEMATQKPNIIFLYQ